MKLDNSLLYNNIEPVTAYDDPGELLDLIFEMFKLMDESGGIGLAANQVGINKRIFVMRIGPEAHRMFINPKVLDLSQNRTTLVEGCLSFPDLQKAVTRPDWVEAEWQDIYGTTYTARLTGLEARVFLHELDHLNGITINER